MARNAFDDQLLIISVFVSIFSITISVVLKARDVYNINSDTIDKIYILWMLFTLFDYLFRSLSLSMYILITYNIYYENNKVVFYVCTIFILLAILIPELIFNWYHTHSYYDDLNPIKSDTKYAFYVTYTNDVVTGLYSWMNIGYLYGFLGLSNSDTCCISCSVLNLTCDILCHMHFCVLYIGTYTIK